MPIVKFLFLFKNNSTIRNPPFVDGHAPENLEQKSDMSLRKLIIRPIHMGLFSRQPGDRAISYKNGKINNSCARVADGL